MKAVNAVTRIVRLRCSRLKPCVKWMKKGTTPIGLTIASSAISGLRRSMRRLWRGVVRLVNAASSSSASARR